jgi:hypothetical protein
MSSGDGGGDLRRAILWLLGNPRDVETIHRRWLAALSTGSFVTGLALLWANVTYDPVVEVPALMVFAFAASFWAARNISALDRAADPEPRGTPATATVRR